MDIKSTKEFLKEQLTLFAEQNSPTMGELLGLTIAQITFLQLLAVRLDGKLEKNEFQMIRNHLMETLELSAKMAGIPDKEIDQVISKSLELVDCLSAIADPTRTNLH